MKVVSFFFVTAGAFVVLAALSTVPVPSPSKEVRSRGGGGRSSAASAAAAEAEGDDADRGEFRLVDDEDDPSKTNKIRRVVDETIVIVAIRSDEEKEHVEGVGRDGVDEKDDKNRNLGADPEAVDCRGRVVVAAAAAFANEDEKNRNYETDPDGDDRGLRRKLFELGSPFESFNEECRASSSCSSPSSEDETTTLAPALNPCPLCGGYYSSQHCHSCCYGGATSLKVRWHGCMGTASIPTLEEGMEDCGLDAGAYDDAGFRFVDCGCYDDLLDERVRNGGDGDIGSVECETFTTVDLPLVRYFCYARVVLFFVSTDVRLTYISFAICIISFDSFPITGTCTICASFPWKSTSRRTNPSSTWTGLFRTSSASSTRNRTGARCARTGIRRANFTTATRSSCRCSRATASSPTRAPGRPL